MKTLLTLGCILVSSVSFAEEYYAPIKKELEPFARIPMPAYRLNDEVLEYTLPRDLTGRTIKVDLTRDNASDSSPSPRIYKGPMATVACMGSDLLPACVVTHKDLNINVTEVNDFLKTKYKDPKKLGDAINVAASFSAGNEPLGFMSKRSLPTPNIMPVKWNVQVLRFGKDLTVNPETTAQLDMGLKELKITGEWQGFKLDQISEETFHISATFPYYQGNRWIDLTVATDKLSFDGTWGIYDAAGRPQPALGILKGLPAN